MAEAENVTFAFLDGHPVEAARVIETLSGADAAALFETISPRLGAPVLSAMLPPAAARILARIDEAQALALLSAASTQATVGVLRHIGEPVRSRLLASLPPAAGVATQLLLGFPDDAVGAWTDPDVIALAPMLSAEEALSHIRASDAPEVDTIYVTDTSRRLQGEVALPGLLRAPEATPLAALMQPTAVTLSAMMPIGSAVSLGAWQRAASLPVVDHDKRLLGVLRRARLAQAARERTRPGRTHDGEASLAGLFAGGYWAVVSGLIGASLALLPHVKRVRPDDR
ncbi:MAG: magnesium transporter MgtE N-terminal domain-containing protein [Burkholderiales bacterium]